jgi:sugar-specific transcriptional regulator TrmB
MEISALFQRIGLNKKESAIYVALLEGGQATVSEIARRTALHRPAIYRELAHMRKRGLVEKVVHGKQQRYIAAPPERLESLVEQTRADFGAALPELHSLYEGSPHRPVVRFLEGKHGVRAVFEDLIRKSQRGDVFYRYSSRKDTTRGDAYLPSSYREDRDRKQLERFVITSTATAGGKRPRLGRMTKVIPPDVDLFAYDVTQIIYRDTVAFIDYQTEMAFIVESPTIAQFQKRIFKLLFDRLS